MTSGQGAPWQVAVPDLLRSSTERVLGWDFLRGLCALAVCTYHLFIWMDIAALHTFGFYGVYLFFVLSGASLAYTYGDKICLAKFSFADFLVTRYFRLAPLYLALVLTVLPWKLSREPLSVQFLSKLLLNVFLLFGVYHPSTQSMLVGGWSLGIEAVFYLFFPLMMWLLGFRYFGWIVWMFLLALQAIWILNTVGAESGYVMNSVAYHHVPAFAAYFMGGCLLGSLRRTGRPECWLPAASGIALVVAGFMLMLVVNTADAATVLVGWRGVLLTAICFLLVTSASLVNISGPRLKLMAVGLGNATYGLYLIHPVMFFGITYVVLPKLGFTAMPSDWPLKWRFTLAVSVISASFLVALLSERYLEAPIRLRVRRSLDRRACSKVR